MCSVGSWKKIRVLGSFKLPVPPVLLPFLGFAAKWCAHPCDFSRQNDAIHFWVEKSKARQSSQSSHSQTSKYLVSPIVIRQSPVSNPNGFSLTVQLPWFDRSTPRCGRTFGHRLSDVHSILLHFLLASVENTSIVVVAKSLGRPQTMCWMNVTWCYKDFQFSKSISFVWIQLFGLRTWS